MNFPIVLWFFAFITGAMVPDTAGGDGVQGVSRSWGQPSLGLRSSISADKTNIAKGEPFVVSLALENVSGVRVDLRVIAAFHLWRPSQPPSRPNSSVGGYWCPINPAEEDSANRSRAIVASPSQLMLEKGASLSTTMDLTRHGWDEVTSSWWPVRNLNDVVSPGNYRLRLDIQTGSGEAPQWIRSNEITITIGNRKDGGAAPHPAVRAVRDPMTHENCGQGRRG